MKSEAGGHQGGGGEGNGRVYLFCCDTRGVGVEREREGEGMERRGDDKDNTQGQAGFTTHVHANVCLLEPLSPLVFCLLLCFSSSSFLRNSLLVLLYISESVFGRV